MGMRSMCMFKGYVGVITPENPQETAGSAVSSSPPVHCTRTYTLHSMQYSGISFYNIWPSCTVSILQIHEDSFPNDHKALKMLINQKVMMWLKGWLYVHWRIPPQLLSFWQAFLIITPTQYWISGGSFGGGLGRSVSVELGLKVNYSTRGNTLVWHVALRVVVSVAIPVDKASAFSFPWLVTNENALKKLLGQCGGWIAHARWPCITGLCIR